MQENIKTDSYQRIFAIAVPMILSAISIPMLGIVDTAILGHLDSPVYLASINIGATIFNVLFWGFAFLKMSTTGLVAQAFGENNLNKINQQLSLSLLIALSISLILVVFSPWIGEFAVNLVGEGGESSQLAQQYFSIRILSAPATLILYVMFGYFLAIQETRKVLALMLLNQVGNMILDYIFVMQFHWGVAGVAYGSIISEYAALALGSFYLLKGKYSIPKFFEFKDWLLSEANIKQFFSLNRDIFIRTLALMAVFAMMTKGSARLGELALAANAVLLNFFYLMSYGLDGFAHAVESLCGKSFGAKNEKELSSILRRVFMISFVIAVLFTLLYLLYGDGIVSLLTSLPAVRDYSSDYMIWLIIVPIVAMPSFVYDGLFVAVTEAKIMRNSMVIATVFCYIPLWYLLRPYDNHGLWMAFLGFFVVRTSVIYFYYRIWIKNWRQELK
ncbi:MAG: MATE family efflux transporter [Gammaproteobacteria bacterium]